MRRLLGLGLCLGLLVSGSVGCGVSKSNVTPSTIPTIMPTNHVSTDIENIVDIINSKNYVDIIAKGYFDKFKNKDLIEYNLSQYADALYCYYQYKEAEEIKISLCKDRIKNIKVINGMPFEEDIKKYKNACEGNIDIGSNYLSVLLAYGLPTKTNETIISGLTNKQLIYPHNVYIYVDNDIVTGIQK